MKRSAPVLVILFLIFSCNPREEEKKELFSLLSSAITNVDFNNRLTETGQFNIIQYLYFNNGAGVAAGDINNDGRLTYILSQIKIQINYFLTRET